MMKQDDTCKLYNYVCKNAQMGVGTTSKLLSKVNDPRMSDHLREEHRQFSEIYGKARDALRQRGSSVKGLSPGAKARTSMMISFETARNDSDSHVAKMLMNGCNMGVIQAVKTEKKCPAASGDAKGLMQQLMQLEEGNFQALKSFL